MEQRHKDLIVRNVVNLINYTDLDALLPKLQERGVFPDMLLEKYNSSSDNTKMNIFLHLFDKGLPVFLHIMEALYETGQFKRMQVLNSISPQNDAPEAIDVVDYINVSKSLVFNVDHTSSDKIAGYVCRSRANASASDYVDIIGIDESTRKNPNPTIRNFNNVGLCDRKTEVNGMDGSCLSGMNAGRRNNLSRLPDYYNKSEIEELLMDLELKGQLKIDVRPALQFLDDPKSEFTPYPMRGNNRGTLLLINNIYVKGKKLRRGANIDERNLKDLFSQLGFEIHCVRNLTYKKMKKKIIAFTGLDNLSLKSTNCCFVIIMSHGGSGKTIESSHVYSSNGKALSISWIVNQFNAKNCSYLSGKPKVFLYQCCRGDKRDWWAHKQIEQESVEFDGGLTGKCLTLVPVGSDILIGHATVPGYVAHRSPLYGSWYIRNICKVFMEYAHNTDVERMLNLVCMNMLFDSSGKENPQVSSYENRGFRLCFLHPKLYVE